MESISSAGGAAGISNAQFAAQYAAKTASLQKDAIEMEGEMATKLIESAGVQGQGHQIDFKV